MNARADVIHHVRSSSDAHTECGLWRAGRRTRRAVANVTCVRCLRRVAMCAFARVEDVERSWRKLADEIVRPAENLDDTAENG